MSAREILLRQLESMSVDQVHELLAFALSLKLREEASTYECMLLSQSSLAKYWLTEEEDRAWAYLQEGT
jgi:hypothetical protein